ncbi:hypothetical protein E1287_39730 [Actinomadura sp. KC06]|uniref:hypothetical protein n=1 Tax=Actinomadura sp. KC06 TaxID=2530369 RepID=UPI001053E219|nr:hypothetical protein [Actinomadura sp. KC06]TDD22550.1 hypothetical protein E1287_39730 [Actinomadura sp. KC06]
MHGTLNMGGRSPGQGSAPARRRGGHLGLDPAVYEWDEIEASLNAAGFEVDEVLDVPDRPG